MTLGDFFANAPHARPVNPRPIKFTAVAKGKILPGGAQNPHGRPVAATVTAAFVFLGGDGTQTARFDARKSLRKRFVDDETKLPLPLESGDLETELVYQILWRVLYEWDDTSRTIGGLLFPTVDGLREVVVMKEANRLFDEDMRYVGEEHPEVIDESTFRGPQAGGQRLVAAAPNR